MLLVHKKFFFHVLLQVLLPLCLPTLVLTGRNFLEIFARYPSHFHFPNIFGTIDTLIHYRCLQYHPLRCKCNRSISVLKVKLKQRAWFHSLSSSSSVSTQGHLHVQIFGIVCSYDYSSQTICACLL